MTNEYKNIISVKNLTKYYPLKNKTIKALSSVSIDLKKGETLGCVGESGSGKSTLAKMLTGYDKPSSGSITLAGNDLLMLQKNDPKRLSSIIQYIFQDPDSCLNPRMTVGEIVAEPIVIHRRLPKSHISAYVAELFSLVELNPTWIYKYPHELSGGEKQRISIARALSLGPEILICDEPISALDVITQESILSLFQNLKKINNFTSLFISHDLLRTRFISDRIAVMFAGHLVEVAPTEDLFTAPKHPYTHSLLSSIPLPSHKDNKADYLEEEIASAIDETPTKGCVYSNLCKYAKKICFEEAPETRTIATNHRVACHLYDARF
ncbi:peptide ABC transporter ATP-binding protein [Candidatus Aerophobetes bacterium]|uniref:Peptide ABC transporter ATP-binding protein n=1 Tax=Aerophobetes bacterium TaxID=2030807 RepID=A0A2A4WZQ8_UNCAE|nr:MAG: peptide ABC transporter ATP-binding protein [Candidatus Aerophobetes bacterium]